MKSFILGSIILATMGFAMAEEPKVEEKPDPVEVPSHISQALLKAEQGHVVELPDFPLKDLPRIGYQKVVVPGPQFLIADDPEYIRVPEGVALRERVEPGGVRLYVYNVNGVREPRMERRISPVITNLGEEELTLKFIRYSSQKPSTNYYGIGKFGLRDFFQEQTPRPDIKVPPGTSAPIDDALENAVVKFDELVHGLYEFEIDQPAEISVVQTSLEESGPDAAERIREVLPVSGKSGAGRGIFWVSNYEIHPEQGAVIDTTDGAVQLIVADGESDPWIKGKDTPSGTIATLAGNYGVVYDMYLDRKSSDGKAHALITWNYRAGGQWCDGSAMSVVINDQVIVSPTDRLVTKAPPEAVLLHIFPPLPEGETETIHIRYSPPGASCLPVPFIFVPVEESEQE